MSADSGIGTLGRIPNRVEWAIITLAVVTLFSGCYFVVPCAADMTPAPPYGMYVLKIYGCSKLFALFASCTFCVLFVRLAWLLWIAFIATVQFVGLVAQVFVRDPLGSLDHVAILGGLAGTFFTLFSMYRSGFREEVWQKDKLFLLGGAMLSMAGGVLLGLAGGKSRTKEEAQRRAAESARKLRVWREAHRLATYKILRLIAFIHGIRTAPPVPEDLYPDPPPAEDDKECD